MGSSDVPLIRSVRHGERELSTLPMPTADFAGRDQELAAIEATLTKRWPATIVALSGLGGVGKTSLAIKAARRLAPRFPDGILFNSLSGSSSQEVMAAVVRTLAPTARPPSDAHQLSAMYRDLLAGKRVLLIFDDVADPEMVRSLTPPSPAAMLVTSRLRLDLPDAVEFQLDTFSKDEAVQLLRETLRPERKLEDADLQALASACAFLPLALRMAAAFLKSNPQYSVSEFLDALAIPSKGGDARETTLGTLLSRELSRLEQENPELSRRLRLLGVFAASFSRDAAQAIWRDSASEAQEYLDALCARFLVQTDHDARFVLHDLTREFIQERHSAELLEARELHAAYGVAHK